MAAEIYTVEGSACLCIENEKISIFVVGLAGAEYEPVQQTEVWRLDEDGYYRPEKPVDPVTERIGESFHTWNCSARFGGECICERWKK